MKKIIIDKNRHQNMLDIDKIECIESMDTKIIVYLDSGNYLTILGCEEKERENFLEQLQDEKTSKIHTQCRVKFVNSRNTH